MVDGQKIGVVIPAAGSGTRMGSGGVKQFLELEGKPIILRTLERFQAHEDVDCIVVAAGREALDRFKRLVVAHGLSKVCEVVVGGEHRQDSVSNGLHALKKHNPDLVVVHDGVRPFAGRELISSVIRAALKDRAAVAAVRPKDTLKVSQGEGFLDATLNRESVWLVQTPQAFRYALAAEAFERAAVDGYYGSDDASLVERLGTRVRIVEGSYENIKITTPDDLLLASVILTRGGSP